MGINTQGFFSSDIKLKNINNVLKQKLKVETKIENTHDEKYKQILFTYKGESRMLSVFEDYTDKSHTGKDICTLIDLNCWGSSVEIIKSIVEEFGGYMIENDSSDDGWTYINKQNILMPLKERVSKFTWRKQLDAAIKSGNIEKIEYFWNKHEEVFNNGSYEINDN